MNTAPAPPAAGIKAVFASVAVVFAASAAEEAETWMPDMAASRAVLVKVADISFFVISLAAHVV